MFSHFFENIRTLEYINFICTLVDCIFSDLKTCFDFCIYMGFLGSSAGKESSCNAGDLDSIPGLGRSPWRREWLPTPVFWPGEFHGLFHGVAKSWTCRPQSMGSLRVRHDWATSLSLFTFLHWRRKWQPTPLFLLGESQGWGSLVGCRLWGRTELDTTEVT